MNRFTKCSVVLSLLIASSVSASAATLNEVVQAAIAKNSKLSKSGTTNPFGILHAQPTSGLTAKATTQMSNIGYVNSVDVTTGTGFVVEKRTNLDKPYNLAAADATLNTLRYTRNFFNGRYAAYTMQEQPNAVIAIMFGRDGFVQEVGVFNPHLNPSTTGSFTSYCVDGTGSWNIVLPHYNVGAYSYAQTMAAYAQAGLVSYYNSSAVNFSANATSLMITYWNADQTLNEAVGLN